MKTEFFNNKDNIATSALIAVTLFAAAAGLFNSTHASASRPVEAVQKMAPIVVTASRSADVTLDTIYVVASRKVTRV